MIPNGDFYEAEEEELEIQEQPSRTYQIDIENQRITGYCDGIAAVKQAIYKVLNTERYQNTIYDWDYGIEAGDLIGQPINEIRGELEERINEALLMDDRILSIRDFSCQAQKKSLLVTFTAVTADGDIAIEQEVV